MKRIFSCLFILFTALTLKGQNVGVGTTTPLEKFHVAGNVKADTIKTTGIKFTPNAGTGKILTSDADGNASWQTMTTNTNGNSGGGVGFGAWGDCAVNANISGYNPVTHPDPSGNDQFGKTLSISGNYAIIGTQTDDVEGVTNLGSASIFHFDGEHWVFMQLLTDPNGAGSDLFGITVSISGNWAIVGSPSADINGNADQGSASVFHFDGSTWVFVEQLTDPTGEAGDNFGYSVSIDNNLIIIGAYTDDVSFANQGSASIYQFDGSSWQFVQQLSDPSGAADDLFGRSVSISGNYALVGAYADDVLANIDQGSASIFYFDGSSWVFMQQLIDINSNANDNFGWSVSISGNYAVVGASHSDLVIGNQGTATVFRFNGTNWVNMNRLSDATPSSGDQFGFNVSISGNYLIVGENKKTAGRGSATIYQRVGLGWQKVQYITDPAATASDEFGVATAIDGTTRRFVIGAFSYQGSSGKAIFGKLN